MYTNSKSIKVKEGQVSKKSVKPLFAKLGPAFKQNSPEVAAELAKCDADKVAEEINRSGYYILHTKSGNFNILPEHFATIENVQAEQGVSFKCGAASNSMVILGSLLPIWS